MLCCNIDTELQSGTFWYYVDMCDQVMDAPWSSTDTYRLNICWTFIFLTFCDFQQILNCIGLDFE